MDLYNFKEKQPEAPAGLQDVSPVAARLPVPTQTRLSALIPALGAPLGEISDSRGPTQIPALDGTALGKPAATFAASGASGPDEAICIAAILDAEKRHGIPENLLLAIGLQEAGRQIDGQLTIWPWSVNSRGQSHMFPTRAGAAAFARAERASGQKLVDVGCMQVNLHWHPDAFASVEEGFDPAASAEYAASFLMQLQAESGDWMVAAGNYHSRTAQYHRRYLAGVERNLAVAAHRAEHFAALAARAGTSPSYAKTNIANAPQLGQDLGKMMARRGGFSRQTVALPVASRAPRALPALEPVQPERLTGAWWSAAGSGADRARSIYSNKDMEPVLPVLAANRPLAGS